MIEHVPSPKHHHTMRLLPPVYVSSKRSPRDLIILLEHPISEVSIHTQRTVGVIWSIVLIASSCELLTSTSELFFRFLDSRHSLLSPKRSPRDLVILLEHPISEFSIHTQRTIGVICSIVLIACELLTTSELFLRFLDSRHSRLFLKRLPRDLIVARLTVLLM